jgi:hypothetical protein
MMNFATTLSARDIAVLEEAVETALDLSPEWNVTIEEGQLATLLCRTFVSGERDPRVLADMVVSSCDPGIPLPGSFFFEDCPSTRRSASSPSTSVSRLRICRPRTRRCSPGHRSQLTGAGFSDL